MRIWICISSKHQCIQWKSRLCMDMPWPKKNNRNDVNLKQLTKHAIARGYRVTVSAFMISAFAGAPSPKKILRLKAAPSESGSGFLPKKHNPRWQWLWDSESSSQPMFPFLLLIFPWATTCTNMNEMKIRTTEPCTGLSDVALGSCDMKHNLAPV